MNKPIYKFENAVCKNVVDGDTIDVIIDVGFKIKVEQRLRLNRIDAPEIRGKEKEKGLKTKEYLMLKFRLPGPIIIIETQKTGKYGRYLAEIWLDGKNLNDELVEKGLAEYREY